MTYFRRDFTLQNVQGLALSGALIYICSQPVTSAPGTIPPVPLATIYSDSGGTALSNPVVIDGQGNGFYYAAAGFYTEVYVYQGNIVKILADQNNAESTVSNIILQSNGVTNDDQGKLNLYSSDATVTITPDGAGNVDLQATSGGGGVTGVQINSTPVADQALINFVPDVQGSPFCAQPVEDGGGGAINLHYPIITNFGNIPKATDNHFSAGVVGVSGGRGTVVLQTKDQYEAAGAYNIILGGHVGQSDFPDSVTSRAISVTFSTGTGFEVTEMLAFLVDWSITSNVLTVTVYDSGHGPIYDGYKPNMTILFESCTGTAAFLNGNTATLTSVNDTGGTGGKTQLVMPMTHADGSGTENGLVYGAFDNSYIYLCVGEYYNPS